MVIWGAWRASRGSVAIMWKDRPDEPDDWDFERCGTDLNEGRFDSRSSLKISVKQVEQLVTFG